MAAIYMPFGPLEEKVLPRVEADEDGERSDAKLGAACGVTGRAWARWRNDERVPWASADSAAVRLGFIPRDIWQETWDELDAGLIEGIDRKAARAVNKAMDKIGEIMVAEAHATLVAAGQAFSLDPREHALICEILDAAARPKAVC